MSVKLKSVAECTVQEGMTDSLTFDRRGALRLALSYQAPGLLALREARKGLSLKARLGAARAVNQFVADVVRAWPPESWPQA